MPIDPYAVLRALLRAEAVRNAPKPAQEPTPTPKPKNSDSLRPLRKPKL
ncbi:hypothetical protein AB0I69_08815 [Streptomyces sp. NPDC050508]